MTQMVTRCPKCSTAFRITSAQLDSAKGSVRCGSCLHIFKAKDHLVSGAAATKPEAKSVTASPASKSATSAQKSTFTATKLDKTRDAPKPVAKKTRATDDDDDMLISDDMDKPKKKEAGYEFDGFLDLDMHPKQTVSLFEREIRYDEDEKEKEHADESWAEQLLDDDEKTLRQLKSSKAPAAPTPKSGKKEAAPAPETKRAPEAKRAPEPKAQPSSKTSPPKPGPHSTPVFSLINDGSDDHGPSDEFISATSARKTPIEEIEAFGAGLFDPIEDESDQATTSKRHSKTSSKMHAFDTSRAALLMNIIPAPVEFTARRVRRWYQKKLWPTVAFIAAIALIFQIAYFKFGYFSRVEPYRTAYTFICPVIGCKVPTVVDTHQIIATNLIVRNHPKAASALMVDAILVNNAPFDQPFPDLLLAFSTLDDTPVALRRFTPKEYLAGELAGMDHIPMHTPVHITLELSDPGPDAVNYHMSIP